MRKPVTKREMQRAVGGTFLTSCRAICDDSRKRTCRVNLKTGPCPVLTAIRRLIRESKGKQRGTA